MSQVAQVIITIADITDEDRHNFSDMHKDAYGFRPRHIPTDKEIVYLINEWPSIMAEQREIEEARLLNLSETHGIEFKNWAEYYDFLDRKEIADHKAAIEQQVINAKLAVELADPHSPRMAIELWDHGKEHLLTGI